jgi:hypothetical protein
LPAWGPTVSPEEQVHIVGLEPPTGNEVPPSGVVKSSLENPKSWTRTNPIHQFADYAVSGGRDLGPGHARPQRVTGVEVSGSWHPDTLHQQAHSPRRRPTPWG